MSLPSPSDMRVEYVALSTVQRWPRNPKLHDEDNLDGSIKRFGFVQPLLMDESTGRLVAGHGRLEALQRAHKAGEDAPKRVQVLADGTWAVPVIRGVAFANETEAEAFLLADNRLVELGGWDEKALESMLADIGASGTSLDFVGFDVEALEQLSRENTGEAPKGVNPLDRAVVYEGNQIKQVVLYFEGAEFDAVVQRMDKLRDVLSLQSNTELFLTLMAAYEASSPDND